MPFIFTSNDVEGFCFRFLENGDDKRNELFLVKPIGNTVRGTLALQVFNDRNYKRITFADRGNSLVAAGKRIWDYYSLANSNDILNSVIKAKQIRNNNLLCYFDFSEQDIKDEKKMLRIEIGLSIVETTYLMCYDFNTYNGCAYRLSDVEEAKEWGAAIGISKAYLYNVYDRHDKSAEVVELSEL